jgi:hypothetical protein
MFHLQVWVCCLGNDDVTCILGSLSPSLVSAVLKIILWLVALFLEASLLPGLVEVCGASRNYPYFLGLLGSRLLPPSKEIKVGVSYDSSLLRVTLILLQVL